MVGQLPDSPSRPALYYRQLPIYARSEAGVDFVIEAMGDIKVTNQGDFTKTEGAELITQALLRRFYTPTNGYKRWVRDPVEGLIQIDATYGNQMYDYLSAPLVQSTAIAIRQALLDQAAQEDRIVVRELDVVAIKNGSYELSMKYTIKPDSELKQLNYVLTL